VLKLTLLFTLIFTASATAQDDPGQFALDTGKHFLEHCGSSDPLKLSFCRGFTYGFLSGLTLPARPVCFPARDVKLDELRTDVINWIKRHRQRIGEPTPALMLAAWQETFPCNA
jgi:hypothetical protein